MEPDDKRDPRTRFFTGFLCVVIGLTIAISFALWSKHSNEQADVPEPTSPSAPVPLAHAQCFTAERFADRAEIEIKTPWRDAATTFHYRLLPKSLGASVGRDAMVVRTPVQRIVVMSTSYLPSLEMLGSLDRIVGVAKTDEVTNPKVRELIRAGKVKEVGDVNSFSPEAIVSLAPDVVFTFGIGPQDLDAYRPIRQAGVPVVVVAEYVEPTPLGRAEWVKFFALFLDKDAAANEAFAGIEKRYRQLVQRAQSAKSRPTVLVGNSYRGAWYVPGGRSFMAHFLRDAGARYLWEDNPSTGVLSLDFETVFDRGRDADFWINTGFWNGLSDAVADDPRYGHFRPYREKNIYNNLGSGPQGARDLWENGFAHPDRVLADLVKVFHPELAADHAFNWYKKLQ